MILSMKSHPIYDVNTDSKKLFNLQTPVNTKSSSSSSYENLSIKFNLKQEAKT